MTTTVEIRPPKLPYPMVVREDYATDGSRVFVAEIPELPGCMSHGESPEEALQNLEEAAELYLEALSENGQFFPAGSALAGTPLTLGTGSLEGGSVTTFAYEVVTNITVKKL